MESEMRKALNSLLSDQNFQKMHKQLEQLSCFHIMGIQKKEVPFTRLLAWILDPNATHGMGKAPLKAFLQMGFQKLNSQLQEQIIDPLTLENINYSQVQSIPEKSISRGQGVSGRLDVCVQYSGSDCLSDPCPLLVIEAKIEAAQHNQQTDRYSNWIEKQKLLGGKKPLMVYLVPDIGDDEINEQFLVLDFDFLQEWLDLLLTFPMSGRALFLIKELVILNQTERRVTQGELGTLCDDLSVSRSEEIRILEQLPYGDLPGEIGSYLPALKQIGIGINNRLSKGFSLKISATRKIARKILGNNKNWSLHGGEGSLTIHFIPLQKAIGKMLGREGAINGDFWLDRNMPAIKFSLYSISNTLKSLGINNDIEIRRELVDSLRQRLQQDSVHSQFVATGKSYAIEQFELPDFPASGEISDNANCIITESIERIAALEEILIEWIDNDLQWILEPLLV